MGLVSRWPDKRAKKAACVPRRGEGEGGPYSAPGEKTAAFDCNGLVGSNLKQRGADAQSPFLKTRSLVVLHVGLARGRIAAEDATVLMALSAKRVPCKAEILGNLIAKEDN